MIMFLAAVQDEEFFAAVCFIYRRYLAGRCVLAVTGEEQAWVSKDSLSESNAGDLKPLLVRVPCIPVKMLADTFVHWTGSPIMMPNEMFEHLWKYFPQKFKELLGGGLSLFWDKVIIKTIRTITETCNKSC